MSRSAKPELERELENAHGAEQASETTNPKGSRRDLFWGGIGIGTIMKACGNRVGLEGDSEIRPDLEVIDETGTPAEPPETIGEQVPLEKETEVEEITGVDDTDPSDISDMELADCSPLGIDHVDTSAIPTTDLNLKFRFYKGHDTWMIVFGISEYSLDDPKRVTHFSLLRSSGQIIATNFLSNASVRTDGKLRPLILEGIDLRGKTSFTLVFSHADGSQSKLEAVEGFVRPETHFQDSDFIGLSAGEVHSRFYLNQAMGNFSHSKTQGYKAAEGASYVFTGRSLMTMQQDVTTVPATGLNGFVLTDLLGNELEPGASFTDIVEHQNLVCYKIEEGTWFRTIIKVG